MTRTPHTPIDKFTLPRDIPDAAFWAKGDTLADAQRKRADALHSPLPLAGNRRCSGGTAVGGGRVAGKGPASRTQQALPPTPSHQREGEEHARDYALKHPAGRGWAPQPQHLEEDEKRPPFPIFRHEGVTYEFLNGTPHDLVARLGGGEVFTPERRVRFLDHLAMDGNARAAARSVGVSHETAYRARRRDAAFARLWDAALVLARGYAEQVMASRALEGVEVPIVYRGEVTGYVVRQDPRLLMAHLVRLDKRVEEDRDAVARAPQFEALLAEYAGHAIPEDLRSAAAEADAWTPECADVPASRELYIRWRRGQAARSGDARTAEQRMAAAEQAAGAECDALHEERCAVVERIVGEACDAKPPSVRLERSREATPDNPVTPVNPRRKAQLLAGVTNSLWRGPAMAL